MGVAGTRATECLLRLPSRETSGGKKVDAFMFLVIVGLGGLMLQEENYYALTVLVVLLMVTGVIPVPIR